MKLEIWLSRRRMVGAGVALMVTIGFLMVLPLSLTRTVRVTAKVLPAREWLLMKTEGGSLQSIHCDHLQGTVEAYTVVSVIRGDAFGYELHASRTPGSMVEEGDTIVCIRSHELAREYQRLSGELAVARANLDVLISGEKEPIAMEAQRSLALARERADLQGLLLRRQDSLYRRDLIAREEYELVRSAAQQAAIEEAIAEARVQAVESGSKPETVRMVQAQITALERDLKRLSDQINALTIVAPFSGMFLPSSSIDTLCTVEDTMRAAVIAMPIEKAGRMAKGLHGTLRVPGAAGSYEGVIVGMNPRVRNIQGRQVILATMILGPSAHGLPTHLVMVGAIQTERVPLGQYVLGAFSDIWSEMIGATAGA